MGIAGCYSGDLDAGEAALRPLRSFGSPVADLFRPMPYTEVQKMLDWWAAPQQQHYWKSSFMREMDDAALDAMLHFVNRKPSPACAVVLDSCTARHSFLMLGQWASQAQTENGLCWVREFWEAMRSYLGAGVYVNYLSEGEAEERIRGAYGMNYERLVKLKKKYDPTNFFRINQNIGVSKVAA